MSVGAVGSEIPFLTAEAAAAPVASTRAEAAVVQPKPLASAEPAPAPKSRLVASLAKDAFTSATQERATGAILAQPQEAAGALADLRAAKQDLRVARQETGIQGTIDRLEARQDIRTARARLADATTGEALPIKPALVQAEAQPAIAEMKPAIMEELAPAIMEMPPDFFPPELLAPELVSPEVLTPQEPAGPAPQETQEAPPQIPAQVLRPDLFPLPTPPEGEAVGKLMPPMSQLEPEGFNRRYANGDMNCAPTAVAMIARNLPPETTVGGVPIGKMTDAELINALGRYGDTDALGTSPNGVIAMAEELGRQTVSQAGGFDKDYYDAVLANGGSIVANGAFFGEDGEPVGHFVTVTARTTEGNYVVNDPWTGECVEVTPQQLDRFLRSNPANPGVSIAIF